MPDRVLVTGGAGFIGSRLVRRLVDDGREVTVLDALVPSVHGPDAALPESIQGARFVRGDVRDDAAWRDALEGVGTLFHLAAETGTGESMYRSRHYVDVNVGGTALLCDLVLADAAPDLSRVVLASSRAVYGEGPYRCADHGVVYPAPRTAERMRRGLWEPVCPECGADVTVEPAACSRPMPTSVYGVTKRDQEELLHQLLPPAGTDVVSLRLQNVYGPGQSLRNPYTGILSIFSVRLLAAQGIRIFEDGSESRDFVFVDDAVEAFVAAMGMPCAQDGPEVLDVGSGAATSVLDVARGLADRYQADPELIEVTGEFRVGDIRHAVAGTTALTERLGLTRPTPLEGGLDALAAWVRTADRPESTLDRALEEMAASGLLGRAEGA